MSFYQQTDTTTPIINKRSLTGLLITFICAIVLAGCSGGASEFVATPPVSPGGVGTGGSGSVTFNFANVQADVVSLRISSFTGLGGGGAIVDSVEEPSADSIVLTNVPTEVNSFVATFLNANGLPVSEFVTTVVIPDGGNLNLSDASGTTVPVVLESLVSGPASLSLGAGGSVPVTITALFSNDDTVALNGANASLVSFLSQDPNVVAVDADGVVSAVAEGSTTIVASLDGQTVNIPVVIGAGGVVVAPPTIANLVLTSVEAAPVVLPVGTVSQPLTVTSTDTAGVDTVEATDEVIFTTTDPSITVNSAGQIAVSSTATPGATATISASFEGLSDSVSVQVSDAVLSQLTVDPASLSIPFGGFDQQLTAMGTFSDGTNVAINAADLTFAQATPTTRFAVDATGLVVSALTVEAAETSPITVTENISGSALSVDVPVTVGDLAVTALTVTPSPASLAPGEVQEFTVSAILSDGTTEDVTGSSGLVLTEASPNIAASGQQVVAVAPTGVTPAIATFTFAGVSQTVDVNVVPEFITEVVYEFAGNEIENGTVNLPRGYVGIVEVQATFNTGVSRRLNFNEYDIVMLPDTSDGAVQLWNDSYTITPADARYTDGVPTVNTPDTDIEVDDFYFGGTRETNPVTATVPGSNLTSVATRPTFRGVVADWRRGELSDGGFVGPGGTGDLIADAPVAVVAPGAQQDFQILLDASVTDPANPSAFDETISVTVTDPLTVTIQSVQFRNYQGQNQVPIGSVREFEVIAQFGEVTPDTAIRDTDGPIATLGPFVNAQSFKLAEANITLSSSQGGANAFGFNTPTALGLVGVSSDTQVDVNSVAVQVGPVAGLNARPVRITILRPDDFDPYYIDTRIFGATPAITFEESLGEPTFDQPDLPGPPPVNGNESLPLDIPTVTVTLFGDPIVFLRPILFSLDPINPGGVVVPLSLQVGQSQLFQTLFQFEAGGAVEDRSLDYLPTLITNAGSPSFVAREELNADGSGMGTGRLLLSAVDSAGAVVTAPDVDAAVLGTGVVPLPGQALSSNPALIAALGANAQGIVVALDVLGNPIQNFEVNPGTFVDSLGATGSSQSAVTVNATP